MPGMTVWSRFSSRAYVSRQARTVPAESGHIATHEAGAVEYCGHKVLTPPQHVGKLDAGEIRAMRDFFAEHLGHQSLPEEGYFIWQNGWWAQLFNADTSAIDVLERAGVHDIMTAAMYFGHANHPSCEPNVITDVRFDPLRFPKDLYVAFSSREFLFHFDDMTDPVQEKPVDPALDCDPGHAYIPAQQFGDPVEPFLRALPHRCEDLL